jgi:hypothetical protein
MKCVLPDPVARGTVSSAHDVGAALESPPPSEASDDASLASLVDPSLEEPPSLDAASLDEPSEASVEASETVPSWLVWLAPSAVASPPAAASLPEDDVLPPPHATS